jgi:hypothetical protein
MLNIMKMIKKGMMVLACCAIFSTLNTANAQTLNSNQMKKKILFVVTSHDKKGSTGAATGYYLGEVSHAWKVLKEAGYEIDFVSPKGGNPPVDGFDLSDAVNKEFWEDQVYHQKDQQ